MEKPEKRYAKIYDISNLVEPFYEVCGYVRKWTRDTNELIKLFIKGNNILPGDLLYTGSTYESRQGYGFIIVTPSEHPTNFQRCPWIHSETPMYIVGEKEIKEYIQQHNIKYKKMVESLYEMDIGGLALIELFSYAEFDVETEYKKMGIWD